MGEALLAPTRIYIKALTPLLKAKWVKGFAHITGGGLLDNVPRILPEALRPDYDEKALIFPPLFQWLKQQGKLSDKEMMRTFNCGIGGVIICAQSQFEAVMGSLEDLGEQPFAMGRLVQAE